MPKAGGGGTQFRYRDIFDNAINYPRNSWTGFIISGVEHGYIAPVPIAAGGGNPNASGSEWEEFTASVLTGPAGPRGIQGVKGNSTIAIYIRQTSGMPPDPTGTWNGTTLILTNGYSVIIPTGSNELFRADAELDNQNNTVDFTSPQAWRGPIGLQGQTGATGTRGPRGLDGPQGPQGILGPQGVQGIRGVQGPAGDGSITLYRRNASTPPIPTDGAWDGTTVTLPSNWSRDDPDPLSPDELWALLCELDSVNNEFTPQFLHSAQGSIGPQGPPGPQGIQGDQGDQGARGQTGPGGAQGGQGIQGVDGQIGPVGGDGPIGPRGHQGDQGDQGDQGVGGPIGPQGSPGVSDYQQDWLPSTTYAEGHEVKRGTDFWFSKVDNNQGNDPETDDGTNWGNLLGGGTGAGISLWVAGEATEVGEVVLYHDTAIDQYILLRATAADDGNGEVPTLNDHFKLIVSGSLLDHVRGFSTTAAMTWDDNIPPNGRFGNQRPVFADNVDNSAELYEGIDRPDNERHIKILSDGGATLSNLRYEGHQIFVLNGTANEITSTVNLVVRTYDVAGVFVNRQVISTTNEITSAPLSNFLFGLDRVTVPTFTVEQNHFFDITWETNNDDLVLINAANDTSLVTFDGVFGSLEEHVLFEVDNAEIVFILEDGTVKRILGLDDDSDIVPLGTFKTFLNSIGYPRGGTTGQIAVKASDEDRDTVWVDKYTDSDANRVLTDVLSPAPFPDDIPFTPNLVMLASWFQTPDLSEGNLFRCTFHRTDGSQLTSTQEEQIFSTNADGYLDYGEIAARIDRVRANNSNYLERVELHVTKLFVHFPVGGQLSEVFNVTGDAVARYCYQAGNSDPIEGYAFDDRGRIIPKVDNSINDHCSLRLDPTLSAFRFMIMAGSEIKDVLSGEFVIGDSNLNPLLDYSGENITFNGPDILSSSIGLSEQKFRSVGVYWGGDSNRYGWWFDARDSTTQQTGDIGDWANGFRIRCRGCSIGDIVLFRGFDDDVSWYENLVGDPHEHLLQGWYRRQPHLNSAINFKSAVHKDDTIGGSNTTADPLSVQGMKRIRGNVSNGNGTFTWDQGDRLTDNNSSAVPKVHEDTSGFLAGRSDHIEVLSEAVLNTNVATIDITLLNEGHQVILVDRVDIARQLNTGTANRHILNSWSESQITLAPNQTHTVTGIALVVDGINAVANDQIRYHALLAGTNISGLRVVVESFALNVLISGDLTGEVDVRFTDDHKFEIESNNVQRPVLTEHAIFDTTSVAWQQILSSIGKSGSILPFLLNHPSDIDQVRTYYRTLFRALNANDGMTIPPNSADWEPLYVEGLRRVSFSVSNDLFLLFPFHEYISDVILGSPNLSLGLEWDSALNLIRNIGIIPIAIVFPALDSNYTENRAVRLFNTGGNPHTITGLEFRTTYNAETPVVRYTKPAGDITIPGQNLPGTDVELEGAAFGVVLQPNDTLFPDFVLTPDTIVDLYTNHLRLACDAKQDYEGGYRLEPLNSGQIGITRPGSTRTIITADDKLTDRLLDQIRYEGNIIHNWDGLFPLVRDQILHEGREFFLTRVDNDGGRDPIDNSDPAREDRVYDIFKTRELSNSLDPLPDGELLYLVFPQDSVIANGFDFKFNTVDHPIHRWFNIRETNDLIMGLESKAYKLNIRLGVGTFDLQMVNPTDTAINKRDLKLEFNLHNGGGWRVWAENTETGVIAAQETRDVTMTATQVISDHQLRAEHTPLIDFRLVHENTPLAPYTDLYVRGLGAEIPITIVGEAFRSFDSSYNVDHDTGDIKVKGLNTNEELQTVFKPNYVLRKNGLVADRLVTLPKDWLEYNVMQAFIHRTE